MALLPDSPAIDAGTTPCPAEDQRGVTREGACDVGAYEAVSRLVALPASRAIGPGKFAVFQLKATAGSLPLGVWYTIPTSAGEGESVLVTSVQLLAGGDRIYLPLVMR